MPHQHRWTGGESPTPPTPRGTVRTNKDNVPTAYLESYPFPAFVLRVRAPPPPLSQGMAESIGPAADHSIPRSPAAPHLSLPRYGSHPFHLSNLAGGGESSSRHRRKHSQPDLASRHESPAPEGVLQSASMPRRPSLHHFESDTTVRGAANLSSAASPLSRGHESPTGFGGGTSRLGLTDDGATQTGLPVHSPRPGLFSMTQSGRTPQQAPSPPEVSPWGTPDSWSSTSSSSGSARRTSTDPTTTQDTSVDDLLLRATSQSMSESSRPLHTLQLGSVAPVSAPLSVGARVEWANEHAHRILRGRPLNELVDGHLLAAFQEWAESEVDSRETTVFTLEVLDPPTALELVKARQRRDPTLETVLVVLTAIRVVDRLRGDETKDASTPAVGGQRPVRPVHPTVGPALVPPLPVSPDTYSVILPFRRKTRQGMAYSTDRIAGPKQDVAKQCHLLLEELDWTQTSLGPKETWPPEILSAISIAFSSFTQDVVFVGKDLIMVYNQGYSVIIDHPASFGRPVRQVWAPLWPDVGPLLRRVWEGEPVHHENDALFHERNDRGRFVERYHSYSLIPIVTAKKEVVGIYSPSLDTTDRVLAERRLGTSQQLASQVSLARSVREYFDAVAEVLEDNPADAPFVICYSVREQSPSSESSTTVELCLESTVGIPQDHPCAPKSLRNVIPRTISALGTPSQHSQMAHERSSITSPKISAAPSSASVSSLGTTGSRRRAPRPMLMQTGEDQHMWPIARALASRQCVVFDNCSELVKGLPIRQWDELPDMAIVIPLCREESWQTPPGVMILGLNLFRPLDSDYEDWLQAIRSQLVSALGSVTAYEEEVQRQMEKDKLQRAKTAWFRGSAHELRSPLTLIDAPLEDLRETDLTPSQRQSLAMAQKNVHRLSQLVNALHDFTRIESGHVQTRFTPTDLKPFVSELAGMFRPAIERLDIGFTLDIQERDEPVCLDPVLFEIVVSNLLMNALKYTESGTVALRVAYDSSHADISVIDSGSGIPASEIDTVTDWSHRTDTGVNRPTDSTGIGLALVREIVRLHRGQLVIESATADENATGTHGSTFTARIPTDLPPAVETVAQASFGAYGRQMAREVRSWVRDDKSDPGATQSIGFAEGLMFERSDVLLVIDDSKDIRTYIKYMFAPFVTVIEAANGAEGLQLAIDRTPDLVLCDLLLGQMSGLDVLAALRADHTTRVVPFVLLSAATDDETRVDAFFAGADDFLLKPFKPKELLMRVHLHMQMGKKRAKLEKLFAEREQEIAVLSDYCPSGIVRTDARGYVTYTNEAFREPAGMGPDQNPNLWVDYCGAETWTRLEPVWQEILYGDKTLTELQWKWLTGRTMSGVFIRLDKVRPGMSGIIGCVTDISYQEEKLLAAERRRVEAEESKHQQEMLVDLISHEIRTPVSAILQCSSLVKENLVALKEQLRFTGEKGFKPSAALLADLEEDVGALDSIYQCGLVQERIAGDVLSLARIQLDMLSLHDVEMDLRREARKVLSVFASEARMKKIGIHVKFGETLQLLGVSSIKTDPVRLGQVVTNLISNAIRFTASSETRRISVMYDVAWDPPIPGTYTVPPAPSSPPPTSPMEEDTPIYLYVSVQDTGPGMPASETEVLFQRFSQGNKMIHTQYGGTGLGLYICKKITELLGGGIQVQSEVGKGTTFYFFIRATANTAPTTELRSVTSNSTLASISITTPSIAPSVTRHSSHDSQSPGSEDPDALAAAAATATFHVLIVEDNIINQTVLRRQVLKAGLTCDVADNGQEALVAIHEAHRRARLGTGTGYDVVLMDLEMPIMDGLTALKHLRDAEEAGSLSRQLVIALTGNARQGQIDQAISAGMDDVVIKPYHLPDLIAKMRRAVIARRAEHREDDDQ